VAAGIGIRREFWHADCSNEKRMVIFNGRKAETRREAA